MNAAEQLRKEVEAYLKSIHPRLKKCSKFGGSREWCIPHPAGGDLFVGVRVARKLCIVSIDRIGTSARPDASEPWFDIHVKSRDKMSRAWSRVYSYVQTERENVMPLLRLWLPQELQWVSD